MKELNQEQHVQLLQFMTLMQNCKTEEEIKKLQEQYYNIPQYSFLQAYIPDRNENQSFSSYKTSLIYDMDKYQQDYKFVYGEKAPAYRKKTMPNNKADYTVLNLLDEINECDNIKKYQELLKEKNNFPKAMIKSLSHEFTGIYFADGSSITQEITTISLSIPQIIIKNTPEDNFNARKQLVEAGYSLFNIPSVEDVQENGFDWLHEEITHFKALLNPNYIEIENEMNQEPEHIGNDYEEEIDAYIEQMDANGGMSAMAAEADYNAYYENYEDIEDEILYDDSEIESETQETSLFDKELQDFIDGKLPKSHIFTLGKPSEILVKCGFPSDQRIELSASHLEFKSKLPRHTFDLSEIKGLENALKNPIAVFVYGDRNKSQNIIINIEKDGKNFLAGVHFNQTTRGYEVSDIRTLYPKENVEWLNWINQGKLIYGNKEKLQALIAQQRMNVAEVNSQVVQSPLHEHCLESASSILDKFGEVNDIFTDEYPFYEEVKKKSAIEHKFYTYYTEKDNLDARELSVFESEEFYNALKSGDTEKINEYTKTDLHEIHELAFEIYEEYSKDIVQMKKMPENLSPLITQESIKNNPEKVLPHIQGQDSSEANFEVLNPLISQENLNNYDKRLISICQVPQMSYVEKNLVTGQWRPTKEAVEAVKNGTLFVEKQGQKYVMNDSIDKSKENISENISTSVPMENTAPEPQSQITEESQNLNSDQKTAEKNNSSYSVSRPKNAQDMHKFFINNPYTPGTPVPKIAMRDELSGHSTFIEGYEFARFEDIGKPNLAFFEEDKKTGKLVRIKPDGQTVVLTKPGFKEEINKETGEKELVIDETKRKFIKISRDLYEQVICNSEIIAKRNPKTEQEHSQMIADYEEAAHLDEKKQRDNTASNFWHNYQAGVMTLANNKQDAMAFAKRLVNEMIPSEREKFANMVRKYENIKGSDGKHLSYDQRILDSYEEITKGLTITNKSIWRDHVNDKYNTLDAIKQNTEVFDKEGQSLDKTCRMKIGDTIKISVTVDSALSNKKIKLPPQEYRLVAHSKDNNSVALISADGKQKIIKNREDFIKEVQKIEKKQLKKQQKQDRYESISM